MNTYFKKINLHKRNYIQTLGNNDTYYKIFKPKQKVSINNENIINIISNISLKEPTTTKNDCLHKSNLLNINLMSKVLKIFIQIILIITKL